MFALIMTVIIDVMGSNLILPLLPILLVQSNSLLLPGSDTESTRYILYGLSMAAWPMGIFLGTPYLSSLSDTYGRKRILLLALGGTALAFLLSACSILLASFTLFAFCRLLSGFFSGTFSIAQASVTYTSQNYQEKIRKLGWLSFAGTTGAVAGPLLSGYIVGANHSSWSISLPFLLAALLACANMVFLHYRFNEPSQPVVFGDFQLKNAVKKVLTECRFIFVDARTRSCMILFSLLQVGWGFFIQSLTLLLSSRLKLDTHGISLFFMALALSLGLAQLSLRPVLTKLLKPMQLFIVSAALLAVFSLLLAFTKTVTMTYLWGCLSVMTEMLAYAGIISLFSDSVGPDEQGKVMGGTAAIFGLAWMISGALIGQLAIIWLTLPIACCGIFTMTAVIVAYKTN